MSMFSSLMRGVASILGMGLGAGSFSDALTMASLIHGSGSDHSQTIYRRSGGRAHRKWKRTRAAGRR